MAKNILIFSDGTGQFGGLRPDQTLSNVYKLYRACRISPDNRIDPAMQFAFYSAGIGTSEQSGPWYTTPLTTLRRLFSSATGSGIGRNIVDCYEQILAQYRPGDRIYLFGFSRGGYTVRCLANVIDLCGIPTMNEKGEPLPRYGYRLRKIAEEAVYSVYDHEAGRAKFRTQYRDEQNDLAQLFREKYGSGNCGANRAAVYFIGAFDAVASLGMNIWTRALLIALAVILIGLVSLLLGKILFLVCGLNIMKTAGVVFACSLALTTFAIIRNVIKIYRRPGSFFSNWHLGIRHFKREEADSRFADCIQFARHALAIDERRHSFPRALWGSSDTDTEGSHSTVPRFRQMWFAGNHSDIGGSYPESESRLSDIPLQWMIECIQSLPEPVYMDGSKLNVFPRADGMQHCELEALKEVYPRWWPERFRKTWKQDIRYSASGAPLHGSVADRLSLEAVQHWHEVKPYRPLALIYDPEHHEPCQIANAHCLPKDFQTVWKVISQGVGEGDPS